MSSAEVLAENSLVSVLAEFESNSIPKTTIREGWCGKVMHKGEDFVILEFEVGTISEEEDTCVQVHIDDFDKLRIKDVKQFDAEVKATKDLIKSDKDVSPKKGGNVSPTKYQETKHDEYRIGELTSIRSIYLCEFDVGEAGRVNVVTSIRGLEKGQKMILALEGSKAGGTQVQRAAIHGISAAVISASGVICTPTDMEWDMKWDHGGSSASTQAVLLKNDCEAGERAPANVRSNLLQNPFKDKDDDNTDEEKRTPASELGISSDLMIEGAIEDLKEQLKRAQWNDEKLERALRHDEDENQNHQQKKLIFEIDALSSKAARIAEFNKTIKEAQTNNAEDSVDTEQDELRKLEASLRKVLSFSEEEMEAIKRLAQTIRSSDQTAADCRVDEAQATLKAAAKAYVANGKNEEAARNFLG